MIPLDTNAEAHEMQIQVYRRMKPETRMQRGMAMCDDARHIAMAGIRARHPEYSDQDVRWALFRLLLGDSLFRAAYRQRPLLAP